MERKDDIVLLNQLMKSLQRNAGTGFDIEHVLDMSPIMTEARIFDQASKRHFCARIYMTGEDSTFLKKAWQENAASPKGAPRKLPQPSYGIKAMGKLHAHIGAFIPGWSLETYLTHMEICSDAYAVRLAIQLVKTLQILESQNCEHHNIKPSNIMISTEGRVLLKNAGVYGFESAIAQKAGLSDLNDVRYMAPEMLQGNKASTLSDIYQIGLIIFEMVAGLPPFNGGYEAVREGHLEKQVPNPQTYNPKVGVGLVRVLARALAKNPAQRFRNLAELKQALEFLLPAVERHAHAPKQDQSTDPREEARIIEQLNEARNVAGSNHFDEAMKILDGLLMLNGPRNDAISLYRKIWQAKNAGEIQNCLRKAEEAVKREEYVEGLKALHPVFGLQSFHPQALAIQGEIFKKMEALPMHGTAAIPLNRYSEEAEKAMGSDKSDLAEALLTQIMLVPIEDDPQNTLTLRGEKKSAVKMLTLIRQAQTEPEPEVTLPPPPVEQPPQVVDEPVETPEHYGDEMDSVDMGDLFEDPPEETQKLPLPQMPLPQMSVPPAMPVPPEETASSSLKDGLSEGEEDLLGLPPEEEEDLLGLPPEAPAKPPKKPFPKAIIYGGAGLAALVVIAVIAMFVMRGQTRKKAMAAYQAASTMELSGNWSGALQAWDQLIKDFPNQKFPEASGQERYKVLEIKIKQKDESVQLNLARAREIMADTETPINEMSDGPVHYLKKVLELEPGQQEAEQLLADVKTRLSERAWSLWEAKDVMASRDAYSFMVKVDPSYADPTLEGHLNDWIRINVVEPQLKGLDAAIKRKNWEKAFEITEELEDSLENAQLVRERWAEVFGKYEADFFEAEGKDDPAKMLAALDVMVQIRPDNKALVEKKDRLSRTLNLSRIQALEKDVLAAMDKKQWQKAGNLAMKLRALESENEISKNSLYKVRTTYEDQIKEHKNGNPRAALPVYDILIKMLQWKTHKASKKELSNRVSDFDKKQGQLKKQNVTGFEEYKAGLDRLISDFSDFSRDEKHKWLVSARDDLLAQNQRFQKLVSWEAQVRDDIGQTYDDILAHLNKEPPFRYAYAKQKVAQMKDSYKQLINNYNGNVTLVIKAARNLPKGRGAFSKDPKAYCQLKVAGQTFTTDVAGNSRSPMWNFACTFTGSGPLTFNVFNKKGNQLIGVVEIPRVPKNGKNMAFKPKSGDWQLLVDINRER